MRGLELSVRSWRIVGADPSGCMMYFDPLREEPALFRIPPCDQAPGGHEVLELAGRGGSGYVDNVGSVSASELVEAYREDDKITMARLEAETGLPF